MNVKEYLGQAYRLDQRINSKIEQVASLNELATKCTSTFSDMPRSATPNTSRMEDIIVKIIDLQNEINSDIDKLVDLKCEMSNIVKAVDNIECQTLLELRYLCFKSWEQIAIDMGYTTRNIHLLHKKALSLVDISKSLH